MNIFLTGANGFVGSYIIPELLAAGHRITGLTRSGAGARRLAEAAAEPHLGSIEDLASLRNGIERADDVILNAFDHDFVNSRGNCEKDQRVIAAPKGWTFRWCPCPAQRRRTISSGCPCSSGWTRRPSATGRRRSLAGNRSDAPDM